MVASIRGSLLRLLAVVVFALLWILQAGVLVGNGEPSSLNTIAVAIPQVTVDEPPPSLHSVDQRPPRGPSSSFPTSDDLRLPTAWHTLQLSPAALRAVRDGLLPRGSCPEHYLFVNTHTYGRHHNQLQEILNTVSWARTLNRTAVIGWFRYNHRWVSADELYNFTLIYRDYCAVSARSFVERWQQVPTAKRTAVCMGQQVSDTPLKGVVRRCHLHPGVPSHYNTRQGVSLTAPHVAAMMNTPELRHAAFLGVSGQIAFFMRPGLLEQSAVTSRLLPSAVVLQEAMSFAKKYTLRLEDGARSAAGGRRYFAFHLRQREKECAKELNHTFSDGAAWFSSSLTPETRSFLESQCRVTLAGFEELRRRIGVAPDEKLFVASDHQNAPLEQALVGRGAVMLDESPRLPDLVALGVDFHLLRSGAYFSGNQLSSVTQNCCFARLGRGLACHGFVLEFTLFHSRLPIDPGAGFVANIGVPVVK